MKDINFIKNIDNLGRIVIPMDIRRKMMINTGDVLSITCSDDNILLKKYSTLDNSFKVIEIVKCFIEMLNMKIILMDKYSVVYSNVVNVNTKLEGSIKSLVKNGTKLRNHTNEMMIGEQKVKGIYNMIPIITKEGIEGSLIVFGDVNDHSYELCEVLSKIIMLEINIA